MMETVKFLDCEVTQLTNKPNEFHVWTKDYTFAFRVLQNTEKAFEYQIIYLNRNGRTYYDYRFFKKFMNDFVFYINNFRIHFPHMIPRGINWEYKN